MGKMLGFVVLPLLDLLIDRNTQELTNDDTSNVALSLLLDLDKQAT